MITTYIILNFDSGKSLAVQKGHLVIPIVEVEDNVTVYVACPGLDDDDEVPEW